VTEDVVEPDFAVVAVRDDSGWQISELSPRSWVDLEALEAELQATAVDATAVALIGALEEYLLVVRRQGNASRLFLNDVAATTEWPLALDVLDRLGLPEPEEDDLDRVQPVGDIALLAEYGMPGDELARMCEDLNLFNDEVADTVAGRLGFSDAFQRLAAE
jgi:putative tRNA adenosine deaminase-associated protein